MKISKDTSLKWGKETELQSDKVPFTAGQHPSSQQQLQHTKIADKAMSSLLSVSKPTYSVIQDSPQADSGMFSSGSYLSMNGDSEKHGVLSHDQSSMEFYPLHAFVDSDSPKVSLLHYALILYFIGGWGWGLECDIRSEG